MKGAGRTNAALPDLGPLEPPGAARPKPARAPAPQADVFAAAAAFIDALPLGIIILDAAAKVLAFNRAAGEMFGADARSALGRSLVETVRHPELHRRVHAALQHGTQSATELAPFFGVRTLHVTAQPAACVGGDAAVVLVISDYTRLRELQAINRSFVSNVSHELRSPLASIKIMIETLQSGADARAQADFLQAMARETQRLIELVDELLHLARLESGGAPLRMARVDLRSLCAQAVANQQPRAQRAGIHLVYAPPPAEVCLSGDRDKLFQVIVNLLDNALRYTPAGGRVEVALKDGQTAELSVEDSGCGIPSAALPRIFDRFYVVDVSRAKACGGTGLGLAIAKHIIEAHGGTISVQSELGRGSKFSCKFQRLGCLGLGA